MVDWDFMLGAWAGYYETKINNDSDLTGFGTSARYNNDITMRGLMGGISGGWTF